MNTPAQEHDMPHALKVDAALEQLATRRALVVRRVRAQVGAEADAEDIVQRALVRAVERLHTLDDPAKLNAWFDAIVRRLVLDHHSARARASRREHITDTPPEPARGTLAPADSICACSLALLDTLPESHAELLRRVDIEDHPVREVAASLGITANNASVRLHRARAALRDRLAETCGVHTMRACLDCDC
jgi:RNA polymerase sigma-70 factor (ECF subfamily)